MAPAPEDNETGPNSSGAATLAALLGSVEPGPVPLSHVIEAGRRRRRRRTAVVAVAGGALAVSAIGASTAFSGRDLPPPTSAAAREFAATGGEVCPQTQPLSETSDGFGTPDPAQATPEFRPVEQAWVCRYRAVIDDPGPDDQGHYTGWRLEGVAVPVQEAELSSLESALDEIEQPEVPSEPEPCPADLGWRWLVVTESGGDLTGVAIDGFGCRDVRLTDDPLHTEPGEANQPGIPPGRFTLPDGLLELVEPLHASGASEETFTMPELRAQPLSSAREGLTAAGFLGSIAVVPEDLDDSSAVVIGQQPRAGSTMASDGQVTLNVVASAEVFPKFLLIRNDTTDPIWIVEPGKRGRVDPHEQLRYATEWACEGQPLTALTPDGDVLSRYAGECDGSTWRITPAAD